MIFINQRPVSTFQFIELYVMSNCNHNHEYATILIRLPSKWIVDSCNYCMSESVLFSSTRTPPRPLINSWIGWTLTKMVSMSSVPVSMRELPFWLLLQPTGTGLLFLLH